MIAGRDRCLAEAKVTARLQSQQGQPGGAAAAVLERLGRVVRFARVQQQLASLKCGVGALARVEVDGARGLERCEGFGVLAELAEGDAVHVMADEVPLGFDSLATGQQARGASGVLGALLLQAVTREPFQQRRVHFGDDGLVEQALQQGCGFARFLELLQREGKAQAGAGDEGNVVVQLHDAAEHGFGGGEVLVLLQQDSAPVRGLRFLGAAGALGGEAFEDLEGLVLLFQLHEGEAGLQQRFLRQFVVGMGVGQFEPACDRFGEAVFGEKRKGAAVERARGEGVGSVGAGELQVKRGGVGEALLLLAHLGGEVECVGGAGIGWIGGGPFHEGVDGLVGAAELAQRIGDQPAAVRGEGGLAGEQRGAGDDLLESLRGVGDQCGLVRGVGRVGGLGVAAGQFVVTGQGFLAAPCFAESVGLQIEDVGLVRLAHLVGHGLEHLEHLGELLRAQAGPRGLEGALADTGVPGRGLEQVEIGAGGALEVIAPVGGVHEQQACFEGDGVGGGLDQHAVGHGLDLGEGRAGLVEQAREFERGVGREGGFRVLGEDASEAAAANFLFAVFHAGEAEIVERGRGSFRRGVGGKNGLQHRDGFLDLPGLDVLLGEAEAGAVKIRPGFARGDDLPEIVDGLSALPHLSAALGGAEEEDVAVGIVGKLLDGAAVFGEGHFVQAAREESVGETLLLLGRKGGGRKREEQQGGEPGGKGMSPTGHGRPHGKVVTGRTARGPRRRDRPDAGWRRRCSRCRPSCRGRAPS